MGGQNLKSKKTVIAKINHMMGTFDLVDVWRNLHPKDKQWTWSSPDMKITCRLDYWLLSRDNVRNVIAIIQLSPYILLSTNNAPEALAIGNSMLPFSKIKIS